MEKVKLLWQYFPAYMYEKDTYLAHHHWHLDRCVDNGLYASAYSHLHLLYMLFVYVQLLRIAQKDDEVFRLFSAGFDIKDFLKPIADPHDFYEVGKESSVFHLFRVAGFSRAEVTDFSVDIMRKRNKLLHAANDKGIRIDNRYKFVGEVNDYVSNMKNIVKKQKESLNQVYTEIVSSNFETEEGFEMNAGEIENYFSSSEHFFSPYELMLVAKGKTDIVSSFILGEYRGKVLNGSLFKDRR